MALVSAAKLRALLLNTGLQQKDPSLYQVIYDLIGLLTSLQNVVNGGSSSSGGGGGTIIINRTIQQIIDFGSDGDNSGDGFSPPISGLNGGNFTSGSVIFSGPSGILAENNANLFWDNTNKRLGIGTDSPGLSTLYVSSKSGSGGTILERQYPGGDGIGRALGIRFIPSTGVVTANDGIGIVYETFDSALNIKVYASIETIFRNVAAATYEGELTFWLAHNGADHVPYIHMKATDAGGIFAGNILAASGFDLALGGNVTEAMRILANGQVVIGATTLPVTTIKLGVVGGIITLTHTTGRIDVQSTVGNNACFIDFNNSGGTGYIGLENSVGNALVGGAGLPFALVMASPTAIQFAPNGGAVALTIDTAKNVGIGITTPTAFLNIKAGAAAAGSAPIKLTAGTLLTTPEIGAIEFTDDGTTAHLYVTVRIATVVTRVQIA